MTPVFQAAQASHRRWVIDAIERAVLLVQEAVGANLSVGVGFDSDTVRLLALDGSGRPGRPISRGDALSRGYAIVTVMYDDEQLADALSRYALATAAISLHIEVPALERTRFDRYEDLADAVERDVVLAVMDSGTLGGLAQGTILRDSTGLTIFTTNELGVMRLVVRSIEVRFNHSQQDMQNGQGTPAGEPDVGAPVELFVVQHTGAPAADAAMMTVDGETLTVDVQQDPGGPVEQIEFSLIDRTVDQVLADINANDDLTGSGSALHGDLPAEDLEYLEDVDMLGAPAGVSMR